MPTSIWYEVRASVRADLATRYEAYMREKHIRDVLATGAFRSATLERAAAGEYCIRYEAPSRDALERYLRDHAPRLREDANVHFPEGVELRRAEWTLVETFRAGTPTPPRP